MRFWIGVVLAYVAYILYITFSGQINWHPYARIARKPILNIPLLLPIFWVLLVGVFVWAGVLMDTLPLPQAILIVGVALGLHSLLVGFFASQHTARYIADVDLQEKRQAAEELAQKGDVTTQWAMFPAWIPGMHFLFDVFLLLLILFSRAENSHWAASLPAFLLMLNHGKDFWRRLAVKSKRDKGIREIEFRHQIR